MPCATVPPSLLQRQVDHAGPSKIRSTVYVTVNPKNKKGEIEYLYGCLGNTLGVYYVTIDDSAKSSVLTSSGVTETLKGAAFRAVLRKNGSFLPLTWPDWEKGGKGLPLPVVQSLLGGLAKKKGTAAVINAKGGREVSALSKAGMNVVAAFSEGKSEYPGLLVDSKSGHRFGFPEMEASTVGPVVQEQPVGQEEREAGGEKTTDSGGKKGGAKGSELAATEKLARKRSRRAGERVIESSPEPEDEGGDAQTSAEGEGQAKAPEAAEGEAGKGQLSAETLGVEKAQGAAQGEGKEKGVDKEEGEGQEKGQKGTEKDGDSGEGKEKGGGVGGEGGVEGNEEGGEGNEEGGEEGGEEPDPGLEFGDAQFEQYFASLPSAKDGAGGKTEMGAIGGGGGAAGGLGPAAVVTSPLVTPLTVTPVSSGTPQSKTSRDGASLETGARDDMSRLSELEAAAADEGRLLTDEESRELTTLKRAKRKREEEGAEEEEMAGGKHAKKVGGRGAREEYLAQVRAAKELEAAEAEAIAAAGGATGVSGKSGKGKGGLTAEDQAAIFAALQEDQRPRRGKGKK
ncbi:hypothetical protein KFL_012650020 [Klebsormidium nitens]|uniref:Uncharacterized protein n=1 Tax=Klebsormidium nitens TaxID=105231 RepID=A0A1Y1IXM0_KLENI|nr:hypothetical protein KFL_012650020 [Klebsormidium nitens]|eukprot:GAQ93038.1 hypothetical protein KFL_012650020 [Klebsormidium nitens]